MKHAFIFHGTGGYPEENWFPWMKSELDKKGYTTKVPQFPTPEAQTPETWMSTFKQYEDLLNEDTILIGHSLGGTFLLHVLEKYDKRVTSAHFIATPIGIMPIKNIKTDKPFLEKSFDWEKIKSRTSHFSVFHSDNDPYVGLENGKQLAQNLGVKLTFIKNAGHFNKAAGYLEFKELLKTIP